MARSVMNAFQGATSRHFFSTWVGRLSNSPVLELVRSGTCNRRTKHSPGTLKELNKGKRQASALSHWHCIGGSRTFYAARRRETFKLGCLR